MGRKCYSRVIFYCLKITVSNIVHISVSAETNLFMYNAHDYVQYCVPRQERFETRFIACIAYNTPPIKQA